MSHFRGPLYCVDCKKLRKRGGRGLCDPCYKRHSIAGTLHNFDLVTPPTEVWLSDWIEDLEAIGLIKSSNQLIADHFKVSRRTIERRKAAARSIGLLR